MSAYWPWWAGALALGSIAVAHARLTSRPMGVSGSLAKLAHPRDELARDDMEERLHADQGALEAALLAATAAEFGEASSPSPPSGGEREPMSMPPGSPLAGHAAFLLMVAVGAGIAALARGNAHLHVSPGAVYESLFGGGATMLAALAAGGVLVGLGTRMSGGCTSGHGLSGCARLVPASLVATATFLGAAIVTSFLLVWGKR